MPAPCLLCCAWCCSACAQTKRRVKLRQIQETGKSVSHSDLGSVVIKSTSNGDKDPLLPVTIHASSATGLHGQHRKGGVVLSPNGPVPSSERASDKDTV